ncbi:MAG TPA: hypothetical protein VK797_20205 [Tepidisphaeraceae bacterium]|nr:hypothetical protein [Tepidisphaeraceae bacterium]
MPHRQDSNDFHLVIDAIVNEIWLHWHRSHRLARIAAMLMHFKAVGKLIE